MRAWMRYPSNLSSWTHCGPRGSRKASKVAGRAPAGILDGRRRELPCRGFIVAFSSGVPAAPVLVRTNFRATVHCDGSAYRRAG
jgi:hypothetical protein